MNRRWIELCGPLAATLALVVMASPAMAEEKGLAPLGAFVAAARQYSPENREARATAEQRDAEAVQGVARLFPSFRASAGYTRNQYEVLAQIPTGANSVRVATISPYDQLDATLQVDAPLLDLATVLKTRASRADARAAAVQVQATEADVASRVGRAYFQYIGATALVTSAEKALHTAEENRGSVEFRMRSGLASDLDVDRAKAEIASAHQSVADAQLLKTQAQIQLASLSGVAATGEAPALPQGTEAEAPLETWLARVEQVPVVRVAAEKSQAAKKLYGASYAAYAPTLEGTARERFTNATGFGYSPVWSAGVTVSWRLDPSAPAAIRAVGSAASAADAREATVRRQARDAIENAYAQVESQRVRVVAARAQEEASAHGSAVAKVRYDAGTATQLDLLQAARDAFAASVNRIRAEADLAYARFALRVSSGSVEAAP